MPRERDAAAAGIAAAAAAAEVLAEMTQLLPVSAVQPVFAA